MFFYHHDCAGLCGFFVGSLILVGLFAENQMNFVSGCSRRSSLPLRSPCCAFYDEVFNGSVEMLIPSTSYCHPTWLGSLLQSGIARHQNEHETIQGFESRHVTTHETHSRTATNLPGHTPSERNKPMRRQQRMTRQQQ